MGKVVRFPRLARSRDPEKQAARLKARFSAASQTIEHRDHRRKRLHRLPVIIGLAVLIGAGVYFW